MRAIWKGSLGFGLVNIPIKLYAATSTHDAPLHQVHAACGSRITYKRICRRDGQEVSSDTLASGYELPDGDMIVLTEDDLAMRTTGKVALVKLALRRREHLAVVDVRNRGLVLETLHWPDEIRTLDQPVPDDAIPEQELAVATQLIDALTGELNPAHHSDDYQAALHALIDAKAAHEPIPEPSPISNSGSDLLATLQASIAAAHTPAEPSQRSA